MVNALNAIEGVSCTRPDGSFFAYPSCAGLMGRRAAKGRARRDGDRQGRQARPGSAQAFLAVRKQAQERAAKGGSGHWK